MERKSRKKKTNWTNIIRRAIQIASLILMPGLFISVFLSVKSVYIALISGVFSFAAFMPQLLIILAVIPVTIIMGRIFCGFVCSFGALGDFVWFISNKLHVKKIKVSEQADKVLKLVKYALLVFLVMFVWTLGAITINADWNPWNIFGMYTSLSAWSSMTGLLTIGGLLLAMIVAVSFFIERFFCRYLCPLGAVFGIVSKFRLLKIKKPTDACKSCKVCTNNCAMGIDMYKHDVIKSGECIDCFQCIAPCPRQNAQVSFAGKEMAPLAVGVAVSVIIGGMYFAGKATADVAYAQEAQAPAAIVVQTEDSGKYIDGVYKGSAAGYRGETTVKVTVENGYIASVQVTSTDDDMEFLNFAKISVINDILTSQSTDVDAVTGATYSSNAIINAVSNALSQCMPGAGMNMAKAQATAAPTTTQTPQPAVQVTPEVLNTSLADIADGVYAGTGSGFNGDTEVQVTVKDGAIIDVEVVSYVDDRPYFESAMSVIDDILNAQDVAVDAVSGATFSSNSIVEAVANALNLDFTNTNDTPVQEHGTGKGRGGGH